MLIPNLFSLKAMNFNSPPPSGLYDIFNFFFCHFTDYDKQVLATIKSFEDYCLFDDGYIVSLPTA